MSKTPAKKPTVEKSQEREVFGGLTIHFPKPGTANQLKTIANGGEGSPFIAHGPNPSAGTVVASAKVVVPDGTAVQQYLGTAFEEDDFEPEDTTADPLVLDDFEDHLVISEDPNKHYGADDHWAFQFPTLTLPEDKRPCALIVTTVDVNGTSEVIIPFVHDPDA